RRQQCPGPRRPHSDLFVETSFRDQEDGDAGKRGKKAVDAEQQYGRSATIDSKQLENASNQERIERRFPGGRSGRFVEGTAESLAQRKGASDAAHLEAKIKIRLASLDCGDLRIKGAEPVGVFNNDVAEARSKSDDHHPEKRS